MTQGYPKRLIEIDLPIRRISAHARREKSIRHGHISTLHIWWARRPLAACRAVLCAALWPDPADSHCPESFRQVARELMLLWAGDNLKLLGSESAARFLSIRNDPVKINDNQELRYALLDFIADYANWDNSTVPEYVDTSRALTRAAHEGLGGPPGTSPLVVDPFAGGGAIPLEALRIGADAFASDLNPVAVLINKVMLEYVPKYGERLVDEVRKWGEWVKCEAKKELSKFYPNDPDGATPIAYLWARTIRCEGPACGVHVPLLGNLWLSKRAANKSALELSTAGPGNPIDIKLIRKPADVQNGLTSGNSATCPACGYTTRVGRVREQLTSRRGGSADSILLAVVTQRDGHDGKNFRLPNEDDLKLVNAATAKLTEFEHEKIGNLSVIPHEQCPPEGALGFRFQKYGITRWRDLYTPRQLLTLCTFTRLVAGERMGKVMERELGRELAPVVQTILALAVGRLNDRLCTLCRWRPDKNSVEAGNGGQNKMPMLLDFAESTPFGGSSGDWADHVGWICRVIEHIAKSRISVATVQQAPAQKSILPDDSAAALVTDPPYFDAFGYSDLSEFFHIWLRRTVPRHVFDLQSVSVPKEDEAISIGKELSDGRGMKNASTYSNEMMRSFRAARQAVSLDGIGVIVFANKTTAGWEAILEGLISAGWIATASWPIDTELANRQRALGSAALNSSVHIVCRPREYLNPSLHSSNVGDWRDVLQELPRRIHEWMPRLADEGVVGADAIFACIGPALEVFSRYSSVEKANGQIVALREYLEHVWAAVAKEALAVVFKGADASGFEEDARLTAMWLWTLFAGQSGANGSDEEAGDDEESEESGSKPKGYVLEYDAARKIAQGLGAHLESLPSLVEIKGETATLRSVAERTRLLFGKDESESPTKGRKKKKAQLQLGFVAELEQAEEAGSWGSKGAPSLGATVLDRVHQSMILFAAGRGEALRRFLVEEGVGRDERFWRLAQALSFLYPKASDEKRWIDGVLARKKGLGF
jgi:putative DNA methylase